MAELTPWDCDYLRHVAAEFNSLDAPDTPQTARVREVLHKFRDNPKQVQRHDLLELELNLIAIQPVELLIQRAPRLRKIYREMVGDKQFSLHQPTEILPGQDPKDPAIRRALVSDLQNLMSDMHWHYTLDPHRDGLQRDLTKNVITCVVIYTVVWLAVALLCLYAAQDRFIPTMSTVIYAGILGGYVSSLQRIQSVRVDADSLILIHELNNGRYFLWFAPLIGALFAVVLTITFMSGLIGGSLFPSFIWKEGSETFAHLRFLPAAGQDYAKLFVWSFVAGFSERFVPDALDRLMQKAREAENQPQVRSSPGKKGVREQKAPIPK